MSPLRRRSARLRGSSVTPTAKNNSSSRRLSKLAESDETSRNAKSTLGPIQENSTALQTPATASGIKPTFQEIHPGKGHTAAPPTLTFCHKMTPAAIGHIKPSFEEKDLGKRPTSPSPSLKLKCARSTAQLGPEAQKMMDELREEALRIKAKLAAESDQKNQMAEIVASTISGSRKIAMPKGKVGRFSGIHMAEFKKMDSIAGHASAFRCRPGSLPANTAPATKSLKRSQSNAKLDEGREIDKVTHKTLRTVAESESGNGTPAKRARVTKNRQDVVDHVAEPENPKGLSRSRSILASLTTPTQASLARIHATQIPATSQSPTKHTLYSPRAMTKSATMSNLSSIKRSDSTQNISQTPSKLERMKVMLCRPTTRPERSVAMQPTLNSDPPNLDKELPPIPTTLAAAKMKNINFTPRTISKTSATIQASPSPYKSAIPRSKSNMNLGASVNYPSLMSVMINPANEVVYPSLTGAEYPPTPLRKPVPVVQSPSPSVPGTFTFRSDKTISFGTSPRSFGASPGQSSLRQVRPSILPGSMPGAFPTTSGESNKTITDSVFSIPHGIPDKKRRRVDYDEKSKEEEHEPSPKKHKGLTGNESRQKFMENPVKFAVEREKIAPRTRIPSPSKKGILNFSRLNMLARPKMRK